MKMRMRRCVKNEEVDLNIIYLKKGMLETMIVLKWKILLGEQWFRIRG